MSGRDVEPVAAFFPSIDRNLLRDLDRHLRMPTNEPATDEAVPDRNISGEAETVDPPPSPVADLTPNFRPTADTLVEAVQQAASSMTAMHERIGELETLLDAAQRRQHDMAVLLEEARTNVETSETSLRDETARRERVESLAAHHVARANRLEAELATALSDLTRVTDAIANVLGLPETPRAS